MADTNGFISIRDVVLSALNRATQDTKYFEQFAVICTEQLAELNIYHTKQFREGYFPISNVGIVQLPPDYIDYCTNPSFIINNIPHTLTLDNTIPLDTPIDCGEDTNPQPIHGHSSHGGAYHEGYGRTKYWQTGGKNICYFRVDMNNRIIKLRGHILTDKLYIEYVSTGLSLDTETIVPRELMPVLRNYLLWQSAELNPARTKGDVYLMQSRKSEYDKSLDLYMHFKNSLTVDEFLDTIRSSYKQTPKR